MFSSFRLHHAATALTSFLEQSRPLDAFLSAYFRAHRSIGSKDRKEISDLLFDWMKWKSLIEYACPSSLNSSDLISFFLSFDPLLYLHDESIPAHVRACLPQSLFALLTEQYGQQQALSFAAICNERAPLTLRTNTMRVSRELLLQNLRKKIRARPCPHSSQGIILEEKANIHALQEWQDGLFEIQDEASQLVAALIRPQDQRKEKILDYCAGGGGKALAIASAYPSLSLVLHDKRNWILNEAKKRFERGRLPPFSVLSNQHKPESFDWVLLDVPCSGSGTYRRNPDAKWKFSLSFLNELTSIQQDICKNALPYLKPGGCLVYATCSVLRQENENQIDALVQTYPLEVVRPAFRSFPQSNAMDGFFGCILRKKSV